MVGMLLCLPSTSAPPWPWIWTWAIPPLCCVPGPRILPERSLAGWTEDECHVSEGTATRDEKKDVAEASRLDSYGSSGGWTVGFIPSLGPFLFHLFHLNPDPSLDECP
jgi:hypothetical protein